MGAFGGPNINRNLSSLSLDAGSIRSFKGIPTVNLVANTNLSIYNNVTGNVSSTLSQTNETYRGATIWRQILTPTNSTGVSQLSNGNNPGIGVFHTGGGGTANRFTGFSIFFKTTVPMHSSPIFTNYSNIPGYQSSNLFDDMGDGWFRANVIWFDTVTRTDQKFWAINPQTATLNTPIEIFWAGPFKEDRNDNLVVTPFVNGTRGTTVATGGGWVDLSGTNNHGELINGLGYDKNNLGSLVFDGADDHVLTPNITMGNGNVAWTVNVWTKTTTTVNALGQGSIISNSSGGPVYSMLGINNGRIVYWTYQNDAWSQKLGNRIVNDNKWHMLTWVNYTNSTMDMYVDGILDSNVLNSTSGNNNPLNIIGGSWAGRYSGNISTININLNKSITSIEVEEIYNRTKRRFIPENDWEVLMQYNGYKLATTTWTGSGNTTERVAMGSAGTSAFMTMSESSTGANNRTKIGDGVGLYTAFFNKKNITKIALVDGSSTSLNPTDHNNYIIYDLVESTRSETINNILKRLDIYQRDTRPLFHNNDTVWGDPSSLNHSAGTNGYSGLLVDSGGTLFETRTRTGTIRGLPDKFVIMGINRDSDNDIQALCAFWGNLQSGKGDRWRGLNVEDSFWSYWGHDFHSNSSTQRIGSSLQSSPGITTQSPYSGTIILLAF